MHRSIPLQLGKETKKSVAERQRGSLTKCSYFGARRLPAPQAAEAREEALATAATAG